MILEIFDSKYVITLIGEKVELSKTLSSHTTELGICRIAEIDFNTSPIEGGIELVGTGYAGNDLIKAGVTTFIEAMRKEGFKCSSNVEYIPPRFCGLS